MRANRMVCLQYPLCHWPAAEATTTLLTQRPGARALALLALTPLTARGRWASWPREVGASYSVCFREVGYSLVSRVPATQSWCGE